MIKLVNVLVSFGGEKILDRVSWMLGDGQRVGLVGENGSGKSTLLKVMAGEIGMEQGRVEIPRGTRIGYLPQEGIVHKGNVLLKEMREAFPRLKETEQEMIELEQTLSRGDLDEEAKTRLVHRLTELEEKFRFRGGYELESKIGKVLKGLGFKEKDWTKSVEEFSFGWQMRIALGKILLSEAMVLLLDEPTNYLDLEARNWLEEFLKGYSGSYLIVSHDRFFLDVTVDKIVEIERGRLSDYYGSYTYYLEKKEQRVEAETRAYEKQQEEIAKIKAFIAKYKADKKRAGQCSDRLKRLERMELIEPPIETKTVHFKFPPAPRSANEVLSLKDALVRYGDYVVFEGLIFSVFRGEKIALIGENGAGKSTLMSVLAGNKELAGGVRNLGEKVDLAYFGEGAGEELNPDDTVLEAISREAPFDMFPKLRSLLGAFLFSGDDIYKKCKVLSGGEKSRLSLARLLLKPANLLLMDEPTNHLDLRAKEVLLNAFRDYTGTLVFVAHDRYFLEELPARILEVKDGRVNSYLGNYSDYLYAKSRKEELSRAGVEQEPKQMIERIKEKERVETRIEKDARIQKREEERVRTKLEQRLKKRQNELEKVIEKEEGNLRQIEEEMTKPELGTNYQKLIELTVVKKALEQKIEALYSEWDKAEKELELIKSQSSYILLKKK